MTGYVICTTPRSGSTLLCGMLAATGRMGVPDSFYRTQSRKEWAADWGVQTTYGAPGHAAEFLAAARAAGSGETGRFGMRLMAENRAAMLTEFRGLFQGPVSDMELLQQAFGPVALIHLCREDKVAQSVSRVKAEQTGLWHRAPDGREVERLSPPMPAVYDFDRIDRVCAALVADEALWNTWFRAEGLDPLRLTYEGLAENPGTALCAIAERVGVTLDLPLPVPGVARLSDATSQNWAARYRDEKARK